jgi:hypothetical protein
MNEIFVGSTFYDTSIRTGGEDGRDLRLAGEGSEDYRAQCISLEGT